MRQKKAQGLLSRATISSPKRFELLRGNPMYLAGTRLNHSAKATLDEQPILHIIFIIMSSAHYIKPLYIAFYCTLIEYLTELGLLS
jgi:hypothetical protein